MSEAPLTTSQVIELLRGESWSVTPGYLGFLFREGHVVPPEKVGHVRLFYDADVERIRGHLRRRDGR